MNNQEYSRSRSRFVPMEVTPIVVKPRNKAGIEGDNSNDYLGIALPHDSAEVQSGSADEWTLSVVGVTAPVQGFTIYEGDPESQDYNETNLNCLIYPTPKRIEFVTSDDLDAPPYLVLQEVVDSGLVAGWQFYAPQPFLIAKEPESEPGIKTTWQYAVSSEAVTLKQIRFYESCNVSIESPAPSIPGPMFQKVTTLFISEVDIWR